MKIAFTGAQCTGKTTLINELKNNQLIISQFKIIDEIMKSIKEEGFKINEEGDIKTQLKVISVHINNLNCENMITDRCLIDCLVYSIYLFSHNKIDMITLNNISEKFSAYIKEYDIIFYLKPEFNLVSDGLRSDDNLFRNEIAEIFERVINNYKIPVINLSGSIENRMNKIYETLKEYNVKC